jgi:formate hydrogenlyase subunit 6/NADH:ubiquinone oxidoreductase subunit I
MNIFRLIFDNLRRGVVSQRLPHQHQCTSDEYRGLIRNDAERCIGCAACCYACPTGAIEVVRSGDNYSWSYDPGKCTFCACCIARCKPNTLTMESKLPPLYSRQGDLRQVLNMVRKRPARPAVAAAPTPAPTPTAATTQGSNPPPAAAQ